ncbi:MAG: hypothetical protein HYV27_05380 [Candidatus Hydrogenedentes bacterium]|nr:hypothetical protein [Candidatus Hydrogenedentota bacterium]
MNKNPVWRREGRRTGGYVLLLLGIALQGCVSLGRPAVALQRPQMDPPLAQVAAAFTRSCEGGKRESNNCAHFLSDAFIRAGYAELLTSTHIEQRCVCGAGRVVRAQDLLRWFQEKSKRFHAGTPPKSSGIWAVYQEKPGRRHVLLLDTDTGKYYGTDNCVNWPVQWAYQW